MGVFGIFSKTSVTFWFHLLEKEDITVLHMCAKFQVRTIFRSRDRGSNGGQNGSKMGFSQFSQKLANRFGSISQGRKTLSFYIFVPSFESRPFFVLEIQGQMGVKTGQKWGFRGFLKNQLADLVPSPREGRYYHSTYVCQVTGPGHFSFSRYGVKRGSNGGQN